MTAMAETSPRNDAIRAASTNDTANIERPQEQLEGGPSDDAIRVAPTNNVDNVGQPQEQLEVDEGGPSEENIVYPTGSKLWLTMGSLCLACFLNGLVGSHDINWKPHIPKTQSRISPSSRLQFLA